MLTTFDLDEYVHTALAAGASGFLLQDTEVLADAVRTVAGGEALRAPSILRRLIAHHTPAPALATQPRAIPALRQLTDRELEVSRLLGRGLSHHEVARELWISESTVKTHVTRLIARLSLRDRAQAVILAYESH